MVSKISNFIIFGIIIFTNGNPVYRQDSYKELQYNNPKMMLKSISELVKYDILLNQDEDSPGYHHEDVTKMAYNGGKPNSRYYYEKYRNGDSYKETSDENDDLELRCYGNRCGENRDNNNNHNSDIDDSGFRDYTYKIINENYDRHLRCNGKSCSLDRDNDKSDTDLRCYGNICSRKNNDGDENEDIKYEDGFNKDINHILRSSRSDDDDEDIVDSFHCIGDSCTSNRYVDNAEDILRCIGERCSRIRDDDRNDKDDDVRVERYDVTDDKYDARDDRYDFRNDIYDNRDLIDEVRCVGKTCARNRDDNNERDNLSCIGVRCLRNINNFENRGNRHGNDDRDRLRRVRDQFGRNRRHKEEEDISLSIDSKQLNVSKSVVKHLDRVLKIVSSINEGNIERTKIRNEGQTQTIVRNLKKGILELIKFHYILKKDPEVSYYFGNGLDHHAPTKVKKNTVSKHIMRWLP